MEHVLTITVNQNGLVTVNGPIDNKLLCYGLLEAARDIICNHGTRIVQPGLPELPSPFRSQ